MDRAILGKRQIVNFAEFSWSFLWYLTLRWVKKFWNLLNLSLRWFGCKNRDMIYMDRDGSPIQPSLKSNVNLSSIYETKEWLYPFNSLANILGFIGLELRLFWTFSGALDSGVWLLTNLIEIRSSIRSHIRYTIV